MSTDKKIDLDAFEGHTPGEWVRKLEFNVNGPDQRGICSTGGYQTNSVDPSALRRESMANADLIAAAPALLALAKAQREEIVKMRSFLFRLDYSLELSGMVHAESVLNSDTKEPLRHWIAALLPNTQPAPERKGGVPPDLHGCIAIPCPLCFPNTQETA